jgi:hypothetical protein
MDVERNQDLSALLDGELDSERSRFLLQRLGHDDELRQRWTRWQLMSACLKGQPVQALPEDFAQRVLAGLDAPSVQSSRPIADRRGLRWAGGIAVAASVVLAAVLWRPATTPRQTIAVASSSAPQQAIAVAPPSPPQHVVIQPIRIPMPEPQLQLALQLPIPVHGGVVSAYRSPLHPVAIASTRRLRIAHFAPLPQPYAIDPELEAYLAQQKSAAGSGNHAASSRDVFSEHNVYLPNANENAMGTVSWSPDDQH